ncbi:type II toxin-antitoxin system death-on-curing family toxin [Salinibacter sp.]|uniref:type II toxin-antitoxin system death-on-curing family toxin n=2 Tax=Salinibacteraceae TaxID=1853225 RepID=UPI00234321AE
MYCHGIVRNHPFVDGNTRTGLLTVRAFLARNGYPFGPDEAEMVQIVEQVAAGETSEDELARWIEKNSEPQ